MESNDQRSKAIRVSQSRKVRKRIEEAALDYFRGLFGFVASELRESGVPDVTQLFHLASWNDRLVQELRPAIGYAIYYGYVRGIRVGESQHCHRGIGEFGIDLPELHRQPSCPSG